MPIDSDPITISGNSPDDFTSILLDIASSIQYKLFGLMLIIFIFISSDVFINRALAKFNGAVDYKCPTSWGTFLQGLFLVLSCIIIDAAIRQKII
ncbi:Hypothetical protein PACV_241 [Pacmanvirus A23]|uniref:Hypothetical protein n=1 Tax=Pacmanvirus A23 TaxID=1932881 RepID=UPI000A092BEA|nr:Hypothetical protein B9W72_gp239 [Pacmanvirus A23]SIP85956.1 Hypothetical protein PACV_241 [Pacmanvirus A23]